MGIFKNPIILLSLVSMGLFFGMPKLVENSELPSLLLFVVTRQMLITDYSGPRDARRVGGATEGEPDERADGRHVGAEPEPVGQL